MKIANIDNFLGTGKDFDEYFNKYIEGNAACLLIGRCSSTFRLKFHKKINCIASDSTRCPRFKKGLNIIVRKNLTDEYFKKWKISRVMYANIQY